MQPCVRAPSVRILARVFAVAILSFTCVALLCGCSDHLTGTHDAALDYQIINDEPASSGGYVFTPQVAAVVVKQRLTAAQVNASVDETANGVHVVIDQDLAEFADELIRWRGGVKLYLCDPAFPFAPTDTTGLEQVLENGERYYVGTAADVNRALGKSKLAAGHIVLGERIGEERMRTRVLVDPPLVDLFGAQGILRVDNADGGRSLKLTVSDAGNQAIVAAAAAHPHDHGAKVAIVRASTLLDMATLDDLGKGPIVARFGDDIRAYSRAYANRRVIATLNLPKLVRVGAATLAASWAPAIACIVLPLAISIAWLVFVRRFDRGRPEPWWLVLATFALGGVSVLPAGFIENALGAASPYMSPQVMTLGGQLMATPIALLVYTVTVGLVEEGVKLVAVWSLAGHRRELDEPVDGIVYACAAALGFAAMENVRYFAGTRLSGSIVAARSFLSVPAHMLFAAIWGYAFGRKLVTKKTSLLAFFVLASLVHGAFDTMLSIDGLGILAIVLVVVLAFAFVHLLRKSLRHGAVEPEAGEPPASSARAFFRMGSQTSFAVLTVLLMILAAMIMGVGTTWEVLRHRVSPGFLLVVTTLLALFGVVAWFLTEAIPLDAAVDERGITFGGVAARWEQIRDVVEHRPTGKRAWLLLDTTDGDLRIGPTTPARMEELMAIVKSSVARAREREERQMATATRPR